MRFPIDPIRKLLRLTPGERRFVAEAWLLLLVVDLVLRWISFPTILARCQRVRSKPGQLAEAADVPSIPRAAWLVEVAGRYSLVRTSCLKEALVLSWLMSKRGLATTLKIGVARQSGVLAAHAWVEQNGQIILGSRGNDAYVPLLSLHL